jgi:hypothetical protein
MKRQDVFDHDPIDEADDMSMKSGVLSGELAMYRADPRFNKPVATGSIDLIDVGPVEPQPTRSIVARISRKGLALAALLFLFGMVGAVLWPKDFFHRNRDISQIGVPIGVAEASPDGSVPDAPAPAATGALSAKQSEPAPNPASAESASATQVAANNRTPESSPLIEKSEGLPPSDSGNPADASASTPAKTHAQGPVASTARHRLSSEPKRTRLARTQIYEPGAAAARARLRSYRARVYGPRPDFNQVVVLPSGETVIVARPEPYPWRRGFVERRRQFSPPSQPFLLYLGD